MTDLVPGNAGVVYLDSERYNFEAASGVTLTPGKAVYFNSDGKLVLSNAGAAGTAKFAGIVTGVQGRGVTICRRGIIGEMGVSGLAVAAKVYLSDTPGALADAAGTVSKVAGVVVVVDGKKALFIDADWLSLL